MVYKFVAFVFDLLSVCLCVCVCRFSAITQPIVEINIKKNVETLLQPMIEICGYIQLSIRTNYASSDAGVEHLMLFFIKKECFFRNNRMKVRFYGIFI